MNTSMREACDHYLWAHDHYKMLWFRIMSMRDQGAVSGGSDSKSRLFDLTDAEWTAFGATSMRCAVDSLYWSGYLGGHDEVDRRFGLSRDRLRRLVGDDTQPAGNYPWVGCVADDRPDGVFVTGVVDDGPAYQGGLRYGDRLISWNGRAVLSWLEDVREPLDSLKVGQEISVRVDRYGVDMTLSILVGARC